MVMMVLYFKVFWVNLHFFQLKYCYTPFEIYNDYDTNIVLTPNVILFYFFKSKA